MKHDRTSSLDEAARLARRSWSASTRMPPASIAGRRSITSPCPPTATRPRSRSFKTFTADLHRLADWLTACGVTSVAMEATGVYWIPIYEILEARGFEVVLVNARHVKNVPGRKSDVVDCEWLRELHSVGLLRGSFRPDRRDRGAARLSAPPRDAGAERGHAHPAHAEGARADEPPAATSWSATSPASPGCASCATSSPGEPTPTPSRSIATPGASASEAEIIAALTGHYRPEHVFVLQAESRALRRVSAAARRVRRRDRGPPPDAGRAVARARHARCRPPRPSDKPRDNEPRFDIRTPLHQLTGVDLDADRRHRPLQRPALLSEIGTDMTPLAHREALHLLADPGAQEQDLRRPAPQLPDPALRQPRRRHPAPGRHEPGPHPDRARRLLSPPGRPGRQGQGHHRHRPQARHPRLSHPQRRAWCTRIRAPPPTTPTSERASFAACASAPRTSASHSSIARPASYSRGQFLRRPPLATPRVPSLE